jgi:hypothetical protein
MGHHGDVPAEAYDDIDESTIGVHEGHPVTVIVSSRWILRTPGALGR